MNTNLIAQLYQSGMPGHKIATQLGCGTTTIFRHLKKAGVKSRSNARYTKYKLNPNAFDKMDEGACYWLGFFGADGCVKDDNKIKLCLKLDDRAHVEKFRDFLESNHPINNKSRFDARSDKIHQEAEYHISSKPLAEKLAKYGIKSRKSFTFTTPTCIPNNMLRHFYRGYFDGDGCVSIAKRKQITLQGTQQILEQLRDDSGVHTRIYPHASCEHIYSGSWAIASGTQLLSWLYQDATVYLDRKYQKYLEWIAD